MRKLLLLMCLLPSLVVAQITQTQVNTEIDTKLATQIRPVDLRFVTKYMTRYIRQADSTANTIVGNYVNTSGSQTGLAGTKVWTSLHTFDVGANTSNLGVGSTSAPLNIRLTNSTNILLRFQPTTGNAVFQAPGTAPTDNGNRLTVDGTTLLNGDVNVGGNIVPTGNGTINLGSSSARLITVFSNNFLNPGNTSFGSTVAAGGILFRQGSSSQLVGGFHATSGNTYLQSPGVAPADNGNRLTVDGTLLTTGTSTFQGTATYTGTWANGQMILGSPSNGGHIAISRGDGTVGLRIRTLNAISSNMEIVGTNDLTINAGGGSNGLILQASNASNGKISLNAGGAITRLSISNTGQINFANVPVFADNAAAASLLTGDVYRTATGVLMIKY